MYELAIEGVDSEELEAEDEAPAPPTPSVTGAPTERARESGTFDDFGAELAASIQERVLGSLERSLGKSATAASTKAAEDGDVEDLATRTSGLEEQIRARVEAALKAKGISRDKL